MQPNTGETLMIFGPFLAISQKQHRIGM